MVLDPLLIALVAAAVVTVVFLVLRMRRGAVARGKFQALIFRRVVAGRHVYPSNGLSNTN